MSRALCLILALLLCGFTVVRDPNVVAPIRWASSSVTVAIHQSDRWVAVSARRSLPGHTFAVDVTPVEPRYPFSGGTPADGETYRVALARELTKDLQFSRAAVNYIWKEFFSLALVEPARDGGLCGHRRDRYR